MEGRKMNKSSLSTLAKAISSKRGLTQAEAEHFITKMFEVAHEGLQEDKQLKMRWLGSFKVTAVKDRESVDVNTGERIVIEGRDKITFTPDNILKEIVNKPFAQFETVVVNDGVDFSDIDEKFAKEEAEKLERENADETAEDETDDTHSRAVSQQSVGDTQLDEISQVPSEDVPSEDVPSEETTVTAMADKSDEATDVPIFGDDLSASDPVKAENNGLSDEVIVISDSVTHIPAEESQPKEEITQEGTAQNSGHVSEVESASKSNPSSTPVVSKNMNREPKLEPTHSSGELELDEEPSVPNRHFMIPKYVVVLASILFLALIGGIGWFAFNYGKMQAQHDQLVSQLDGLKQKERMASVKPHPVDKTPQEDSAQIALREKERQDSLRMSASSDAVKMAEKAELQKNATDASSEADNAKLKQDKKGDSKEKTEPTSSSSSSSKYNHDPRVRTGAYHIVGIAQTITVKSGETMTSISKRYLGAGMECYVEAVNGTTEAKAGQKLKIPKLELKRKNK